MCLPGVLAGMLFQVSIITGIMAGGKALGLGFSVAKTISKPSVFVSGASGVLFYGEIRNLLQVLFWMIGLQMILAYVVLVEAKMIVC